jgi:hypothetical protein
MIVYLLCLLPAQFPGSAQTGALRRLLKTINPLESINQFFVQVRVNDQTHHATWDWLTAPILFAAFVFGLLFLYAAPRLRLEGRNVDRIRLKRRCGVSSLKNARRMVSLG